ncbi:hypothetical protein ILUMI_13813 [Ignelater luminosus]|uniref:Uncharacterized protein n=1 Tax=Ignelater luminosus TaxID=2038154 RepID=A0A8K0GAK1_IGNLU|nr:hypothetical protein ILUMI_13813 [Ignelater luminosus]
MSCGKNIGDVEFKRLSEPRKATISFNEKSKYEPSLQSNDTIESDDLAEREIVEKEVEVSRKKRKLNIVRRDRTKMCVRIAILWQKEAGRPGRKLGDPTVVDLKQLKYSQDGKIQYKLRHTDADWQEFNQTSVKLNSQDFSLLPDLKMIRRPIKKKKLITCRL